MQPAIDNHMYSTGEYCTALLLNLTNIPYIHGYTNPHWLHKLHLDFYMPALHTAIEYDGLQHFKPYDPTYHNQWSQVKKLRVFRHEHARDLLKDKYCKKHHVRLIRIECKHSYTSVYAVLHLVVASLIGTLFSKHALQLAFQNADSSVLNHARQVALVQTAKRPRRPLFKRIELGFSSCPKPDNLDQIRAETWQNKWYTVRLPHALIAKHMGSRSWLINRCAYEIKNS